MANEVAAVIILEKKAEGLSAEALARFVLRARKAVRLSGAVNILLTGNAAMRLLNLRFRKKDKVTDVLSFPADSAIRGTRRRAFAGEIAISTDVASKNAVTFGHSPAIEVKILALHGILHLAGFDHERDNGTMARKEAQLRRMLGLPSSLTERGRSGRRDHVRPRRSRVNRVRRAA